MRRRVYGRPLEHPNAERERLERLNLPGHLVATLAAPAAAQRRRLLRRQTIDAERARLDALGIPEDVVAVLAPAARRRRTGRPHALPTPGESTQRHAAHAE